MVKNSGDSRQGAVVNKAPSKPTGSTSNVKSGTKPGSQKVQTDYKGVKKDK